MKKNTKTTAVLLRELEAKNAVLARMKREMAGTANSISDEARANAEAYIAEKQAEIDTIQEKIAELEADEADHSEELEAAIKELKSKQTEIENALKTKKNLFERVQNFIGSKDALTQFAEVVKNSRQASDFKENWNKVLTANGITPTDLLLPPAILESLNDTWEQTANDFLTLLDITGLKAIKVAYDSNDADTSRAHGHQKGKDKKEQELTFVPKEIRAQTICKYIQLDRETVDFEDENGVLLAYVTRELAYRIIHEIMRAVLVGDGRTASDEGKISKIESITRDESDAYVSVMALSGGKATPTISDVAELVDSIEADGDIHLFVSKQTARELRSWVAATGGTPQYRTLEEVAAQLGVAEIHTTKLLQPAGTGKQPVAVAFVGKAYKVVGDITMKGFSDFNLVQNKYRYLNEVYVGGGLAVPNSGAVLFATIAG